MIEITIPGEPVAQGRGRAVGFRRKDGGISARVFDPKKSRDWKATAQGHMKAALIETWGKSWAMAFAYPTGPVRLVVMAWFSCPKSDHRKTPRPQRWHTKRPDADNVLKAVKDAAKGILYADDAQVCDVTIKKMIAAQGEAPRVELVIGTPEEFGVRAPMGEDFSQLKDWA